MQSEVEPTAAVDTVRQHSTLLSAVRNFTDAQPLEVLLVAAAAVLLLCGLCAWRFSSYKHRGVLVGESEIRADRYGRLIDERDSRGLFTRKRPSPSGRRPPTTDIETGSTSDMRNGKKRIKPEIPRLRGSVIIRPGMLAVKRPDDSGASAMAVVVASVDEAKRDCDLHLFGEVKQARVAVDYIGAENEKAGRGGKFGAGALFPSEPKPAADKVLLHVKVSDAAKLTDEWVAPPWEALSYRNLSPGRASPGRSTGRAVSPIPQDSWRIWLEQHRNKRTERPVWWPKLRLRSNTPPKMSPADENRLKLGDGDRPLSPPVERSCRGSTGPPYYRCAILWSNGHHGQGSSFLVLRTATLPCCCVFVGRLLLLLAALLTHATPWSYSWSWRAFPRSTITMTTVAGQFNKLLSRRSPAPTGRSARDKGKLARERAAKEAKEAEERRRRQEYMLILRGVSASGVPEADARNGSDAYVVFELLECDGLLLLARCALR